MDGEIFNSWFGINPSFLAHDCRSQQHTRILASSVIDSFKPSCDSDYTASQQTLEDSRAQLWAFPSPPNVFPLKVIAWNPKVSHHWYINDFYNSKSSKYPSSELQICIFNGHFESFLGGLIVIENCNMSKKTSNLYPSPPRLWHVGTLQYHPFNCSSLIFKRMSRLLPSLLPPHSTCQQVLLALDPEYI